MTGHLVGKRSEDHRHLKPKAISLRNSIRSTGAFFRPVLGMETPQTILQHIIPQQIWKPLKDMYTIGGYGGYLWRLWISLIEMDTLN